MVLYLHLIYLIQLVVARTHLLILQMLEQTQILMEMEIQMNQVKMILLTLVNKLEQQKMLNQQLN
jgi:hypothetical protein